MARKDFEAPSGSRSSALWGTGNRGGESRSNALWGKGGRGRLLVTIALVALAAPIAAVADSGSSNSGKSVPPTYIAPSLLAKAESLPNEPVKVIIQSVDGASRAANAFKNAKKAEDTHGVPGAEREGIRDKYDFINGVAATLKARKLNVLANVPGLTITPDSVVRLSGLPTNTQIWPTASGVRPLWSTANYTAPKAPAIALVD